MNITQRLPSELLAEILGHASVPDVLGMMQVNRIFRDVIDESPLLQHKIELFAAGFRYNTAAGISLPDSKDALLQYIGGLGSLRPFEERFVGEFPPLPVSERTSNGVLAIAGDPLQFFVPGSASRRIPWKKWKIPPSVPRPQFYGFCPDADVLAVIAELDESRSLYPGVTIHLRTLSDGSYHPAAQSSTIYYSPRHSMPCVATCAMSITSSRLKLRMIGLELEHSLVVFDWKSGQLLYELDGKCYSTVEFIDNYRLLAILKPTSSEPRRCLALIDTGKDIGGVPAQTVFCLPSAFNALHLSFFLEYGVHKPSPAEATAPFHQDPAQSIIVLTAEWISCYLVVRIGTLLEFLENHEGSAIGWDDWKRYTLAPSVGSFSGLELAWVSGCRLFVVSFGDIGSGDPQKVEVFDFSAKGRVDYLSGQVDEALGGVRYLSSTGASKEIPYDKSLGAYCSHGSIVFSSSPRDRPSNDLERLHVWIF